MKKEFSQQIVEKYSDNK